MAKRPKDDDLFADSTMTFGEHLEELRGALFRSLAGLVVGFLIGLSFATYVVEWIKFPLGNALEDYYLTSALDKLDEKYRHEPPPEMLTLIEEDRLVPEAILVEPFGFLDKLRRDYPKQFGNLDLALEAFTPDDLPLRAVKGLCAAWAAGAKMDDSPFQHLWQQLSEEQVRQVHAVAAQKKIADAQRWEVVHILNSLARNRSLHEGPVYQRLLETVKDAGTRTTCESIHQALGRQFDATASRRLNRLLLASVFSDYLRRPRYNLVELMTWKPAVIEVQSLSVHEGFLIWIKAALISGVIIASPWIFWQLWSFIGAGLYSHEKHFVHVFVPFSLALFLAGAALAFFFVFEPVLDFLFSFNRRMNIEAAPRISEWLSFVLFLPVGFGISFQLPLVMLFLARIGIFSVDSYLSKWRIAILVIFVLAMLLTPADPVSMLLMAVPLTILYFGGIALCLWFPRRRSPFGDGDEP